MTPLLAGRDSEVLVTKVNAPSADVSVTNFASPDPVPSLANLTYSITITNNGPDSATAVTLSDTIPSGTTFQSFVPNAGCVLPAVDGTGTVSCAIGTLANGATAVFTLVVKVTAAAGVVPNTATVTADPADPTSANDPATVNP